MHPPCFSVHNSNNNNFIIECTIIVQYCLLIVLQMIYQMTFDKCLSRRPYRLVFLIFCHLICNPKRREIVPHIRSPAVASCHNTSPHHRHCLLVGCCVSLNSLVAVYGHSVYISFLFLSLELPSLTMTRCPPAHSAPVASLLRCTPHL